MKRRILFSMVCAVIAAHAFAQGQGLAGINEATSLMTSYFDPATKLCYAIGAVLGLVALFYAVFTPLSTWGGSALTNGGWNEDLVLVLTMLLNFVLEFLYQKFVVYRNLTDTNDVAKRAMEKEQEKQNKAC